MNHLQEPRDSKMFRLTQSDKYKGENQLVGKVADLTTRGWKPFYYTNIVEDGNYNLDKVGKSSYINKYFNLTNFLESDRARENYYTSRYSEKQNKNIQEHWQNSEDYVSSQRLRERQTCISCIYRENLVFDDFVMYRQ